MIACGERARRCYSTLLVVALAGTLTACGASSGDSPAPARQAATSAPAAPATASTTRPAPTTTSTTMPPYSFDGSVPPPEIVDTGDDYEAILASYDRYLDWLTGHNPDPQLLANVFVEGTEVKKRWESDLVNLRDKNLRMFDVNRTYSATVTKAEGALVSLVVEEEPTEVQLVDDSGQVLDSAMLDEGNRAAVTLVDHGGHWLIGAIVPLLAGDATVQL